MNHTRPIPQQQVATSFFGYIRTKVFIRAENDLLILRQALHNLHGIYHEEAYRPVDLRRGQANAVGVVHGRPHILDQLVQALRQARTD